MNINWRENMKWFKRYSKRFFIVLLGLVAFMYLNNSSLFTKARDETPSLLAHRGLTAVGHLSINKYIKDEISIHFL